MNNLDSWRAFLKHVKMHKFVFGWGALPPLDPLPGLCPGPTGGRLGPLDPRPNLLFFRMTLLFHFIMKTQHTLNTVSDIYYSKKFCITYVSAFSERQYCRLRQQLFPADDNSTGRQFFLCHASPISWSA